MDHSLYMSAYMCKGWEAEMYTGFTVWLLGYSYIKLPVPRIWACVILSHVNGLPSLRSRGLTINTLLSFREIRNQLVYISQSEGRAEESEAVLGRSGNRLAFPGDPWLRKTTSLVEHA